jgi:ppGpp synthetase/RelA/SpoT-type nucleotidyltranferase
MKVGEGMESIIPGSGSLGFGIVSGMFIPLGKVIGRDGFTYETRLAELKQEELANLLMKGDIHRSEISLFKKENYESLKVIEKLAYEEESMKIKSETAYQISEILNSLNPVSNVISVERKEMLDILFVKGLSPEDIINYDISETERIYLAEKIVGRNLNDLEGNAILTSHFAESESGFISRVSTKYRILDSVGFSQNEIDSFLRSGISGVSKEYIDSFNLPLERTFEKLKEIYLSNPIMGGLKTSQSIEEKISTGKLTLEDVLDIGRTRVVFDSLEDLKNAVQKIRDNFELIPNQEKNLFNNPTSLGYRGYHFVVNMNGKPIEIQLQTKNINAIAETEQIHQLYKANKLKNKEFVYEKKTYSFTTMQFEKLKYYYKSMYEYAYQLDRGLKPTKPSYPEGLPLELRIEKLPNE